MRQIVCVFIFITITQIAYPQVENSTIVTEQKTIQYTNGREVFNICNPNQSVIFNQDLKYYWYNDFSNIKCTLGGAGGSLLHGKYQSFDEKGNLINETNFNLGLKDGDEKIWDTSGEIIDIYKYNKGKLVYAKFKSKESDRYIEWNGPIMEKGSTKKIYTSYGHLERSEEVLDSLKFKVTEFYYNSKVKKIYTTEITDWMYDEYIEFYENGKIKIYGKYDQNWRIGDWKWYKEDGTLEAIERHRINKQYNEDNKLAAKGGEYFDVSKNAWIKNGKWIWYKENGKDWKMTKEYEYGAEVEKKKE